MSNSSRTGVQHRVQALRALGLPVMQQDERFDRFTRIAAASLRAPIALVALVDGQRHWCKSSLGLSEPHTARAAAFCQHTIAGADVLVVPDALLDDRFKHAALVAGSPHVRFYAGARVCTADGEPIGTVCVMDRMPRQFGADDRALLRDLASLVEDEFQRVHIVLARDSAEQALQRMNAELETLVDARTHELTEKNDMLRREVRQRHAAETSLRQSEERIRTIIDTSCAAFVSIDTRGTVIEWNPAAERLFGWASDEAIGRDMCTMIIPERHQIAHKTGLARFLATGVGNVVNRSVELPARTRAGHEITVEMTINAFSTDGTLFFGAFLQDITERIEARKALEQKQELLNALLETIDIGVVACDAEGELTIFNRAARDLHGVSTVIEGATDWASVYKVFAADGVTPLAERELPLRRAMAGERVRDAAITICPVGEMPRTVLVSGRRMHNSAGEPIGAVAAAKDVTELAASRERAAESEERLRTIADNLPALIAYVDTEMRYRFANQRYRDWFGVKVGDMLGKTVEEAMGTAFYLPRAESMRNCLNGHAAHIEVEDERGRHKRIISSTYLPHIRDGQVVGMYVLSTDSTAARKHERYLIELAHTDPLTGLPNRRSYEQHLGIAASRAKRLALPMAVAYLDIDNFKQINDTHGHDGGDTVLQEVGARLRGAVRNTDIVARLAGDEFTVILENVTSADECYVVGQKILDAVHQPVLLGDVPLAVTVSVGFSWSREADMHYLTRKADNALYKAKASGRDTVVVEAF